MSTELVRTAEDAATDSLFQNLVTQFADALDCFRELAQNSIDAGSPQIEVWSEFEASDGHLGTITLHVDDFGEGMDENIIDAQLTRLFASDKEGDLTKIGKFGIGFVSVFALNPQAVIVHTGRGGEYWEVLFHADRSFTKTRIDTPVEGTQITIFVKGDADAYNEFVYGIPTTLRRWCGHSETEITFEDRTPLHGGTPRLQTINVPFAVEGECQILRTFDDGTEVAMAFSHSPEYGFYNRGLTLAQTSIGDNVFNPARSKRLARISMKIKSRYLEHTLSRDTVMRDDNYRKAMAFVDLVRVDLIAELLDELEKYTQMDRWSVEDLQRYSDLLGFLSLEVGVEYSVIGHRRIFRTLHKEGGLCADELWTIFKVDGRLLVTDVGSELTRRLSTMNVPIIMGRSGAGVRMFGEEVTLQHPLDGVSILIARFVAERDRSTLWGAIRSWFKNIEREVSGAVANPEVVYLPVNIDDKVDEGLSSFLEQTANVLAAANCGFRRLGTFQPIGHDAPFFVTGSKLAGLMARPALDMQTEKVEAAVNRKHPHFIELVKTYQQRPELACYCLAKSLLLSEDKLLSKDTELMAAAMGRK